MFAGLLPSSRHFDSVREATSEFLAMDAFSCGVRYGALKTAVELVEQGRAVFWTQLAHFRTPLDDLSTSGDAGEALADEFKQVSFRLRKVLDALDASPEDESPRIRHAARLFPVSPTPLFYDLQNAADDGPVIIVNSRVFLRHARRAFNDQGYHTNSLAEPGVRIPVGGLSHPRGR